MRAKLSPNLISFVLVPFSYFYGDERIEDIRPQESELKDEVLSANVFLASPHVLTIASQQSIGTVPFIVTQSQVWP